MKMTIRLITAIALLAGFTAMQPLQAQISYGIKGGLNIANIGGADAPDSDPLTGFHVGGFLGISFLGIVAAEGGVYYSQKGYVVAIEDGPKHVYNYIDIPVVLKFSPLPLFHFYAGPQASLFLNGSIKSSDNEIELKSDDFTSPDFAIVLGAGVNVPGGLRLSVGYDLGVTPINVEEKKVYNRVLKLTIGYKF
ncbi:MAG: PorT family protein [Bacteroidetes bacterium]|nr:MAG: PorT family protein [Bacteroidota bacterium]